MEWPRSCQGLSVWRSQPLKGSGHNAFLLFYTNFQNGNASKKSVAGITTIACIKACCWWLLVRYYDAMSVVQVDVSYYNNNNTTTATATTTTTVGLGRIGLVSCWYSVEVQGASLLCEMGGVKFGVGWGCLPTRSNQMLRHSMSARGCGLMVQASAKGLKSLPAADFRRGLADVRTLGQIKMGKGRRATSR